MFIFDILSPDVLLFLLLEYIGIDSISIIHLKVALRNSKGLTSDLLNNPSTSFWKKLLFRKLKKSFLRFGFEIETIRRIVFDNVYEESFLFAKLNCLERAFSQLSWESFSLYMQAYIDVEFAEIDAKPVYEGFHPILLSLLCCTITIRHIVDSTPQYQIHLYTHLKIHSKFSTRDLYTIKLSYNTGCEPVTDIQHTFLIRLERWLDCTKFGPDCDVDTKAAFLEYVRTKITPLFYGNRETFYIRPGKLVHMGEEIRFQRTIIRKIMNMYSTSREVRQLRNLCILRIIPEERGKKRLPVYRLSRNYLLG